MKIINFFTLGMSFVEMPKSSNLCTRETCFSGEFIELSDPVIICSDLSPKNVTKS